MITETRGKGGLIEIPSNSRGKPESLIIRNFPGFKGKVIKLPLFASSLGGGVNVIYDQEDAGVMQLAAEMSLAFSIACRN
jgi:hypothetical protein